MNRRREAILAAASRLFVHYGPFKTTVADIAREAHVGVGSVYLEFRSKDAILAVLSRTQHERVLAEVTRAFGDGRPAPRRLELALSARIEAFLGCAEGAHGADLFACSCPAIDEARTKFFEAERALFASFLSSAAARGELAVQNAERDAHGLLLAYRAFEPPSLFSLPRECIANDLANVHRLVLEGLLPRRPR